MIKNAIFKLTVPVVIGTMLVVLIFGGLAMDSCYKKETKKDSYELRISDEGGLHIVVPQD